MPLRSLTPHACRAAAEFFKLGEIPSSPTAKSVTCLTMFPEKDKATQEPAPVTIPTSSVTVPAADPDDDFNEPLGERQPGANDAIVCEGGCQ